MDLFPKIAGAIVLFLCGIAAGIHLSAPELQRVGETVYITFAGTAMKSGDIYVRKDGSYYALSNETYKLSTETIAKVITQKD